MITSGIHSGHNASIAIANEGEIIFHLEEERLSRTKYDSSNKNISEYLKNINNTNIGYSNIDYNHMHHVMHAACAFYNSGFSDAIVLVKDGGGSVVYCNNNKGIEHLSIYRCSYPANFELLEKICMHPYRDNIVIDNYTFSNIISDGLAFELLCNKFGYHFLEAGKIMGMSSYGNKEICNFFDPNNIDYADLNMPNLNFKILDNFDIQKEYAFTLQKQSEENTIYEINSIIKKYQPTNICFTGGFFLNCVANYKYLDLLDNINFYFEPISSDAGLSIGIAKYLWFKKTGSTVPVPQKNIYYGNKFTTSQIYSDVYPYQKQQGVENKDIAKLIAGGKSVGLFGGHSESGPRALGNRSIVFNPTIKNGKNIINEIKKREWYRPFAGSVLQEHCHDWFDMKNLSNSDYMLFAVKTRSNKIEYIPSVLHIDNTSRIQTVNYNNKNYYNLIKEFYQLTGVPILFNTSFNLAGEPLVETPSDAIKTFLNSDLDYLYFIDAKCLLYK